MSTMHVCSSLTKSSKQDGKPSGIFFSLSLLKEKPEKGVCKKMKRSCR